MVMLLSGAVECVSERDLRKALFRDYDVHSRPVKDTATAVNITVQMALSAVVDLVSVLFLGVKE